MIANWVLTYALYSSILLGLAWICSRLVPDHWHAVREAVWKSAIVMAFVSATLGSLGVLDSVGRFGTVGASAMPGCAPDIDSQLLADDRPATPRPAAVTTIGPLAWTPIHRETRQAADTESGTASPGVAEVEIESAGLETTCAEATCGGRACAQETAVRASAAAETGTLDPSLAECADSSTPPSGPTLASLGLEKVTIPLSTWTSRLLVLLLVVGGTIGTYRASLSWIRIRRYLGRRSPIVDGPAFEELRELCRLAGLRQSIRLTDMGSGSSPLALGVREICIPEHSFSSLPPGERRSALAHELAHLVRRDPLWFTALHVLESVFFFLPLHRLARREIQRSAEFLCDDWATVLTGSRLDLARCLAKVAEWRHDPAPVPAASMAGVSPLLARVKRLLEPERPTPRAGRPGLIAAVVAVAIAGPVFGPRFTSGGTAVAAVEGEDYGEEYVVRSSRSGVRAPSAKVVELAPSAKLVELAPSARVVELAPSAPVAVVPAPSGGPLVLDLLDEDSPLLVELIPSSPHAPMVLDEVALEELAALDIAELPGQMILDLSDAARTLDLTAIDPDFGEVLILPDGDLRDLQHGTMTVRVAGDDYDLTARIENDDLIEVELDGEEIPLDRCEFDGETLTILDEDLESEMYTTRVPVERLRGLGPELLELRTSRLPELRESLPEFRERLRALEQRKETSARDREERRQAIQEARDAYLRAREEARALSERSRDHALSQEDRERFRVDRERAIAEAKRATELEAQLRTEQQRFQSGLWESRARTDELRSDQLRVLAQQLRSQKRNLERQLEDLELRIQELETNDADAPSPDGGADPDGELAPGSYPDVPATLRYWEEPRK